jgi:DNA-binding Lrp family transcriptional regulator
MLELYVLVRISRHEEQQKGVSKLLSFNKAQCAAILSCLYYQGRMQVHEISEELGLSEASILTCLQILVDGGIVMRATDDPDLYGIEGLSVSKALQLLDSVPINQTYGAQKQKLTLSIRKDVIERCKDRRINISAITEQFLEAVTGEY